MNAGPPDAVRPCTEEESREILSVINEAAQKYRGVIPADCWKEPYMPREELEGEMRDGVSFWCRQGAAGIEGVMGIQRVRDVSLLRHAYVRPRNQRKGVGGILLERLLLETSLPVLVGTWSAATWAVCFYEKHGFTLVSPAEKDRLLSEYWDIPARQIETSVVLTLRGIPGRP